MVQTPADAADGILVYLPTGITLNAVQTYSVVTRLPATTRYTEISGMGC
jgi:hypothetical protein